MLIMMENSRFRLYVLPPLLVEGVIKHGELESVRISRGTGIHGYV
jgi:hypothetical protein